MAISVTILTKNSSLTLDKTLDSLRNFDEVLVYDTGSTDNTLEIAHRYPNVRIVVGHFEGFGKTHNQASQLASHDWILSIDSDEYLSQEAVEEIRSLELNSNCIYQMSRYNLFNGKWIWSCSWHPDFQKRLYNRKKTSFSQSHVHESIELNALKLVSLKNPLYHESYRNIEEFLSKMNHYSTLFANQNLHSTKKASVPIAIAHSLFTFFKSYFLKRGFLQGYEGYLISSYNAHCAFYKYLKLYEMRQHLLKRSQ